MFEELLNCAQKHSADMVICDYYEVMNGREHYSIQNPQSNDRITIWGKMMNSLAGSLWNKLMQNLLSLSNSGYSPVLRLRILEKISNYTDITPIQSYYDNAVFYIAYHALPLNDSPDFNYNSVFQPYRKSINRAAGFPIRCKVLVLLRMIHIPVPLAMVKRLFKRS